MSIKDHSTDYSSDLLRGNTDLLLLSLIDEMHSAYGYQMIKEIEKRSRGFFQCKEGTIYPALRKLESDGLAQGSWQELPSGQRRRYYQITPAGKELLEKKRAILDNFTTAINLVFRPAGG